MKLLARPLVFAGKLALLALLTMVVGVVRVLVRLDEWLKADADFADGEGP